MKIKMTAGGLLGANTALAGLLSVEMPVETGYNVLRLVKQLLPEIEVAIEARQKIITKYGKPNSVGELEVPPEAMHKASPEMRVLAAVKIEVDVQPITLPKGTKTTPAMLLALEQFVTLA